MMEIKPQIKPNKKNAKHYQKGPLIPIISYRKPESFSFLLYHRCVLRLLDREAAYQHNPLTYKAQCAVRHTDTHPHNRVQLTL